MTPNVMMDQLLRASKVTLRMTDNRSGSMAFLFKLIIARYQYGLRGLPCAEIGMLLYKRENGDLVWQIPAGDESYDHRVWDKIFAPHSEEDIAYYLNEIYRKLDFIARARHLYDGVGQVFQLTY